NRSATNCGVAARILPPKGKTPYPAGVITTAMGGSVLASFVQQEPFFTGQNVKVLTPKTPMTLQEKLFYCVCIEANRFRYSTFGREANASFDKLTVPSPNEIPNDVLQKVTALIVGRLSKLATSLKKGQKENSK
ncbi:MAG: restriction endonuclease subunit S, partial [Bacteroidaceae bacterium]|nr:restriction endonuclease subunit S [Bacteroidaceae bacterium]